MCAPLDRLNTCRPNSNPLIVYCAWPAVVSRKCQVLQSVLQSCLPCHSIYSIQDLQKGALSYVDFYCTVSVLYCTLHCCTVLCLYLDETRGEQENTSMRLREFTRPQLTGTPENKCWYSHELHDLSQCTDIIQFLNGMKL